MDDHRGRSAAWQDGLPVWAGEWFLGLYQPSPETMEFWVGVERRELLLRYCEGCDLWLHPRRIICPGCTSMELEWRRSSGTGTIYSYSRIHRAPTPTLQVIAPYVVGIVRLDERVHLFSRFFEGHGRVEIGARVKVEFRLLEQRQVLPIFITAVENGGAEK